MNLLKQYLTKTLTHLSLVGIGSTLRLVLGNTGTSTTNLLPLVLGFLDGLSTPLYLALNSETDQSVLGLKFAEGIFRIVNDAKAGGFSSSVFGAESEENDEIGGGLVHGANDFLELGLGDIGASGVDDVNDHL